ncbi:MAG TPA: YrdB family protein [Roseiflexaceae bacterium]|nr:YrdB family protein [Roseiflexaceae bacterium]
MKSINLGVRFLLELCMLAALAYWGFTLPAGWPLRLLAGLGGPLAMIVVWGGVVAPKARRRLADPWRLLVEVLVFALAALALAAAGRGALAVAFALVVAVNIALLFVWKQRAA